MANPEDTEANEDSAQETSPAPEQESAAPATEAAASDETEAEEKAAPAAAPAVPRRKKGKRIVAEGVVHIHSTFNNTIVSITDTTGGVVAWASAGSVGFKGSRKGTPFAAQLASETAAKKAADNGMRSVQVLVKGPGGGREPALRSLQQAGFSVSLIRDVTPIPHNGCRPPKRRRV